MNKYLKNNAREFSVAIAIIVLFVFFGVMEPIYLSADNLFDILEQATIYGLMGVGITLIIITGGIDLSVGSALALNGALVAQMAVAGVNPYICVVLGLVFGFILGVVNGILVAKLKLQPFIATMGTMSVFRGLAYVVTEGYPVLGVPNEYREIADGEIIPYVRVSVIILIVFTIIMYLLLKKTKLGIHTYAIGGNELAAKLSGVPVDKTKILVYGIAMLGTSLAAIVQIGKLGTGDPTTGSGYELNAIAAAAIGGTSMAGGRGNVFGTLLGAILLSGLKIGLIVLGVDTFYQFIATGVVIIVAANVEVIQAKISSKFDRKSKQKTQS